jgi:perosamine synthetase
VKLALHGGTPVVPPASHRAYPLIEETQREALQSVLDSGVLWGNHSTQVKSLEREWAEYVGARYCVAVNSGTAALHIAVASAGVGPGDEVIVPAYSFLATASCALQQNGIPIFVDVDPETYTIDPARIEERITDRTRAIIPVHVHGLPADMDAINAIAARHGLRVIEDAAQAHGATYRGRRTGTLGDMAAFSLNASKGIAAGEGGLFTTDDVALRDKADSTAVFGEVLEPGKRRAYDAQSMGWMYRTQELSAALARSMLKRLDRDNAARVRNAERLSAGLSRIPGVRPPVVPEDRTHVYHLYRIALDTEALNPELPTRQVRDRVMAALRAEGLELELWTGLIPAQTLFREQQGYGHGCPWTCPYGRGDVRYDLAEYAVTSAALDRSFCTWSAIQPPNDEALADRYVEAFEKVFSQLDTLWS